MTCAASRRHRRPPQGPGAIFSGYAWSLDTFVDYAWGSLGQLKNVLIVLLVVETICVQVRAAVRCAAATARVRRLGLRRMPAAGASSRALAPHAARR